MNSCYLTLQFLHSCVFSLLSQTHSASLFKLLCSSELESQSVDKSENRRRFTFYVLRFTFYVRSLVGHLWYFMGSSCKVSLRGESPVRPDEPAS